MTKIHISLAAFAAVLVLPSVSSLAFADSNPQNIQLSARASRESALPASPIMASDETGGTASDAPAEGNAARKVDLEVEPIQQPAAGDTSADDATAELPPAAATQQVAPEPEPRSSASEANSNDETPVTASRICRKFSAAIAMVIEVPCERRAF